MQRAASSAVCFSAWRAGRFLGGEWISLTARPSTAGRFTVGLPSTGLKTRDRRPGRRAAAQTRFSARPRATATSFELDVKVDPALELACKSGQPDRRRERNRHDRRQRQKGERKLPKDRVYGYQVEISNEAQQSSGNVYDECARPIPRRFRRSARRPDGLQRQPVESLPGGLQGRFDPHVDQRRPCAEFEDGMTARA